MPNEISERAKGPTCTLNVRIARDTAVDLRALAGVGDKLGKTIEVLVAAEVGRRQERRRIQQAIAGV